MSVRLMMLQQRMAGHAEAYAGGWAGRAVWCGVIHCLVMGCATADLEAATPAGAAPLGTPQQRALLTHPTSLPWSSTTGRRWIFLASMIAAASPVRVSGRTTMGGDDMCCDTGSDMLVPCGALQRVARCGVVYVCVSGVGRKAGSRHSNHT